MPLRNPVKGLEALMFLKPKQLLEMSQCRQRPQIMSNDVQLKFFLLTITGHGNHIMYKVRGRMWLWTHVLRLRWTVSFSVAYPIELNLKAAPTRGQLLRKSLQRWSQIASRFLDDTLLPASPVNVCAGCKSCIANPPSMDLTPCELTRK